MHARKRVALNVRIQTRLCLAGLCLAMWAGPANAQDEDQLTAKARLLPSIGPGLRAVRVGADGNLYVLTAPSGYVSVFGKDGKLVRSVPDYAETAGPASAELRAIRYGEDMDVDAAGTGFVAGRGADAGEGLGRNGNAHGGSVKWPVSGRGVAEGEAAGAPLRGPPLSLSVA